MRSLTWKLTIAFLLVGVTGAVLVALIVGRTTRSEFDRFLSTHDQSVLASALADYYAAHGSWQGVDEMVRSTPPLDIYGRGAALADVSGVVVHGTRELNVGQTVPPPALADAMPISVNGQMVGYLLVASPADTPQTANRPPPPDVIFLQRVTWAAGLSALLASVLALILGIMLARTLTQPLRELTTATRAMAGGDLHQQVAVRSRDEIGELATSFNQMSADLTRASQARKQMTADLAHDLRTPLSILRGYTEGLQDGRVQGTPALYAVMHDEVEHLQRLVEDLRVLSLADARELPLNRRIVDPMALLERTALAYFGQVEARGLTLRVEADDDLPSIDVDTDRLTQVLNNLVSNALRHTRQGEIVLGARRVAGAVEMTVSDTGSGIDPEDLPYVFDRFYKADKSRHRTDDPSSGLGLAIAKAIVEAHGSSIAAASAPGAGATFTLRLPLAEARGKVAAPNSQDTDITALAPRSPGVS